MKLYYSKGACSFAVRIVINEIGLSCEYISVDLKTKKVSDGSDYLLINPKGAVPALLTDSGEPLTENAVIQQYLADHAHATSLLPPVNNMARYHVLEWLNYVATELHKGFSALFNPVIPQEQKDQVFIPMLHKKFNYVNQQLEKHKFLTGSQFTLPDAYLFLILLWVLHFKFDMTQWPAIARYFNALKQRPSIAQSLKEEGLLQA